MSDPPVFELEGVARLEGGRAILEIEHLRLGPGVTALEGPNGAGKTTLLNLLAFLCRPERGRLRYAGREMNGSAAQLARWRREVTLVHQHAYLFNTTVAGNVAYGLAARHLPRRRRRELVGRALEQVGLSGLENRRARTLSGGETQRVALARALVLEPRVLLLDEPFSNLDPNSSRVFERIITGLPARGCSVFLVTHGRGQARRLARRVLALENGRLVADSLGQDAPPAP